MRIAVLSFAHERAATYIRLLRERPDVELSTADPDAPPGDPDRGRALADRLGVEFVDGWDKVFAGRPEAVIVAAEAAGRRALVERAAAAGAQILCEQPLALEEADAVAMVEACDRAGVGLTVASPLRSSPAFDAVRRAVAAGELGTLMSVRAVDNTAPARGGAGSGGGALADAGPRLIDLVDAVLDGEPAEQVYAQANGFLGGQPDVASAVLLTVRYAGGTVAALDGSWSRPDADPDHGGPVVTFVGDRATVEFDAAPRLLGGFDVGTGRSRWSSAGPDAEAAMLDAFLAAVGKGERVGPDGAAGLRTLRVIAAARASIDSGRPVAVAATR